MSWDSIEACWKDNYTATCGIPGSTAALLKEILLHIQSVSMFPVTDHKVVVFQCLAFSLDHYSPSLGSVSACEGSTG